MLCAQVSQSQRAYLAQCVAQGGDSDSDDDIEDETSPPKMVST